MIGKTARWITLMNFMAMVACGESDRPSNASQSDRNLIISHVFAPAPAAPDIMALYFSIENVGRTDDTLLAITTDIAAQAAVHESVTENGFTRMRPRDSLPLPAGRTVELAPGALHVMLTQLTQSVNEGDTVRVDLTFARAPSISLHIPVVSYADAASIIVSPTVP